MTGARRAAIRAAVALVAATCSAIVVAAAPDAKASAAAASKKAAPAASAASATASTPTAPVEFTGKLEPGKTFVAEVAFDNNALHIWRPVKDVQVPRQHAWTIDWTNLAAFPALKTTAVRAKPQRFQFKVNGVDVSSGSPTVPWTTIYRCELLAVEGVAGPPAPAGKRK